MSDLRKKVTNMLVGVGGVWGGVNRAKTLGIIVHEWVIEPLGPGTSGGAMAACAWSRRKGADDLRAAGAFSAIT